MAILNFLKKSENARKIFGKRELKIVEKQLLGVNLTQSEKNRLSRDIRKKLDFIREISGFSDEFELKKGAENKKIIEDAKNEIIKSEYLPKIKRVTLFGSAAENKMTLMSDIDIAVEFNKIGRKEALDFRLKIMRYLPERLDIQVYNTLPAKIQKEIDLKGKSLYKRG